ncbi:MAG: hypothetical protein F4X18_13080 [Acidimicrobiia bacterium]|nr:hypothetical protein [Acidimicrobiia bacterium]
MPSFVSRPTVVRFYHLEQPAVQDVEVQLGYFTHVRFLGVLIDLVELHLERTVRGGLVDDGVGPEGGPSR